VILTIRSVSGKRRSRNSRAHSYIRSQQAAEDGKRRTEDAWRPDA
jgi:hypothetical protein